MKKLMFACLLLLGSTAVMYAQDSTSTRDQSTQYNKNTSDDETVFQETDVIATSELPAGIQSKLQGDEYKVWTVTKAYKRMKDGRPIYAVELKDGNDKKKIKFDDQGNVIKEKEKIKEGQ